MRRILAMSVVIVVLGCGRSAGPSAPEHGPHGPHAEPLVHRFEDADEWAKVFDDPSRAAWQKPEHVIEAMQIAAGSTVADVGTGTGYFLPFLSRAVGPSGKVLALDVEPDMIRHVKDRAAKEGLANVEARVVPLDDPGLAPASVDRVLIVDTWHHVGARKAYAAKLATALRPGGAVYVVDFTMDASHGPPKHHRLSPETVIEELKAGGLAAETLAEDLPDQYIVVGRK